MSPLVLSVPEAATSHYVVATSAPPDDPQAIVPWRVSEPFRSPAAEAMKTSRLGVFTIGADEAVWRLGGVLASEDDNRRIREASHLVVVAHRALIAEQPRREQIARAVARAVADAANGVLIDPQAGQVVLRDGLARAERGRFRMGDQWFGTRYDADRATCHASRRGDRRGARSCSCLRITLLGMRRFGLPDLMIDRIACAGDLAALNLLRALACRLLTDQWRWASGCPGQRVRPLDDHVTVDPDDFWSFWGATPFVDGRPVVTRLVPAARETLEVTPPATYQGTRAEWVHDVLLRSLPPLIGCPADEDSLPPRSAGTTA